MSSPSKENISRRRFLKVASAGLAAGSLAQLTGCGPTDTPEPAVAEPTATTAAAAPEPTQGLKTLRFALSEAQGPAETADPALGTSFPDVARVGLCYDQLVWLNDNLEPQPMLAESWEFNDKADVWTFKLRQDVTFHNGDKFTAQDVVYTYRRIMDPETASPGAANLAGLDPDGIEVVDDYTVRFTLPSPIVDLYYVINNRFTFIVPDGATGDDLRTEAIGTGPFKLVEFVPGEDPNVFEKNKDYWMPDTPKVDVFEFRSINEASARMAAVERGQVDVAEDPPFTDVERLNAVDNLDVIGTRTGAWDAFIMRTDTPPFDNNDLRLALKYCADRQKMVDLVLLGYGDVASDVPVPPWILYGLPDAPRERNIEKAKEHLAKAGYPDGIDLDLFYSTTRPYWQTMAPIFKEDCAEAGININLQLAAADTYWSEVWMAEPFCMTGWSARTADGILSVAYFCGGEWNETFWCREEFDETIKQARQTLDLEERTALYQKAQRMVVEEGGSIIPFFTNNMAVKNLNVSGWAPAARKNFYQFRTIDIEA